MGNSGAQSRQVVNEQKDRHAREGGRAKPGREARQGLLRVQSEELGLSADGGPGPRLSVRNTLQFLERIKQAKGRFQVWRVLASYAHGKSFSQKPKCFCLLFL